MNLKRIINYNALQMMMMMKWILTDNKVVLEWEPTDEDDWTNAYVETFRK